MGTSSAGVTATFLPANPYTPVVTDQSALSLSNNFEAPSNSAVNQSGDYAFVGKSQNSVFLRKAGAPAPTRLLQMGQQPLVGITGSRAELFSQVFQLNDSGQMVFYDDYTLPTGQIF